MMCNPLLSPRGRRIWWSVHGHRFISKKGDSHYETLQLRRGATKSDIKQSFYKLSKQYHPDVNKDPSAEATFKAVSEAYDVLGNDVKRSAYDHSIGNFERKGSGIDEDLRRRSPFRNDAERAVHQQWREEMLKNRLSREKGKRWPWEDPKYKPKYSSDPYDNLNVESERYKKWEARFRRDESRHAYAQRNTRMENFAFAYTRFIMFSAPYLLFGISFILMVKEMVTQSDTDDPTKLPLYTKTTSVEKPTDSKSNDE